MNTYDDPESGYVTDVCDEMSCLGSSMHDVEVLRITATNVIARGRRYGRMWLLKGLHPELRDSEGIRRRLIKEFEIHARLHHPSVVQPVGIENIDGLGTCMVQEWIDGPTLREALHTEGLSRREKRRIMREVIAAVAYMHSRGVVHRDLKPANIMLRSIGREPVIIDFGLADTADYVELKQPGGTQGYISPEQTEHGGANPADDVYSLGVIMAELCPEYKRVSRRCTGPTTRRPADGNYLLRAFDRRRRRPRMIASIAGVLAVVVLSLLGAARIVSLDRSARHSEQQVAYLSEQDKSNRALVTSLRDSLTEVGGRLDSARDALTKVTEYEALKQDKLKEGFRIIDDIIHRADVRTFSKIRPGDGLALNEAMKSLNEEFDTAIRSYCDKLMQGPLTRPDVQSIKDLMFNHQLKKITEYQQRWVSRIFTIQ